MEKKILNQELKLFQKTIVQCGLIFSGKPEIIEKRK